YHTFRYTEWRTTSGKYLSLELFFSSRRRHTRSKRDWSSDVCSSDLGEADAVVGGLALAVLLFGLGDGGAVGHVPHGGGLGLIGLFGGEVVQERPLADRAGVGVDGLVRVVPVGRQTVGTEDRFEGVRV